MGKITIWESGGIEISMLNPRLCLRPNLAHTAQIFQIQALSIRCSASWTRYANILGLCLGKLRDPTLACNTVIHGFTDLR
jgi:hypothetical protein